MECANQPALSRAVRLRHLVVGGVLGRVESSTPSLLPRHLRRHVSVLRLMPAGEPSPTTIVGDIERLSLETRMRCHSISLAPIGAH